MTKADTFCRWIHLESYAETVFDRVARARWLRDLGRPTFIDGFAELYADINAIHPFREGNGRAQRAFLGRLARDAHHPVSWEALDQRANETASTAGFRGDLRPLVAMLDGIVVRDQDRAT
jgi:cell filamentation protein